MKKKLLFRADGNSETGLGHLYRLFALVEMYKTECEYTFVTKENTTLNIIPKKYPLVLIPEIINYQEEPNWLKNRFDSDEHIIIADGYNFDSNYQKNIKNFGYQLIYIDDLTTTHMFADIVVNHSPFVTKNDFSVNEYTKLALGTDYAVLRPSFLNAAKQQREVKKIDVAFVCFGGSDNYNLSQLAVKALLHFTKIKKIYVVLGAAHQHNNIFKIVEENPKVVIQQNLNEKELIGIMYQCNFAIVPTSTILYELCCVKMPILGGYYVKNQELIYKGFLEKGAIFNGGNFSNYNLNTFKNVIKNIFAKENFSDQIKAQQNLFDSFIKERFLKLLKPKSDLTIGVLSSGRLGLDSLKKLNKTQNIIFVFTDSNSIEIVEYCNKKKIPLFKGNPRNGNAYSFIKNYDVDVIISVNYLFLIEEDIIKYPKKLIFNIHGSLLPKYRGRTPHVWAIINGETKTGITAHEISIGCDTGKIIKQIEVPILPEDTGAMILKKFEELYFDLITNVINQLEENKLIFTTQNEQEATYFGKRTPKDGYINWSWNSKRIKNWIRAQSYPYPGAYTFYNGVKVIIDKVSIVNTISMDASKFENGTILQVTPKIKIKTNNGAIIVEKFRDKLSIFEVKKLFK